MHDDISITVTPLSLESGVSRDFLAHNANVIVQNAERRLQEGVAV